MVLNRGFKGAASLADIHMQILLVEDEDNHSELIQRAFDSGDLPAGLTVARNLCEARDRLAEFIPDLVIADLLLPDGRGVELVPRSGSSSATYPVVMMTSHGDEKIAVEAIKAGALDYVVKSVDTLADMPRIARRALREWDLISARKRAEERLRMRTQQLLALSHLAQQVLSGAEIPRLRVEAVNLVRRTLEVLLVQLFERCSESGALLLRAASEGPLLLREPFTGLDRLAIVSGDPAVVPDLQQDARFIGTSWREQSLASAVGSAVGDPKKGALGVLWCFTDKQRDFTDDEVHFLRSAANMLAVAIERQRIEARTHKLQNELLRVSRASIMGELGTAVAHELNQPITAVMNYVQASWRLLAAGGGCVSEEILELMKEAVDESERAGGILRRLRQFVQTGELQRNFEEANEVVQDAARLALAEAAEKNTQVRFELEDHLPRCFIDRIQIQQVVFNLVRNAMEALEASPRREITIKTLRSSDAALEVLIQDTGPGVDPAIVDQLFGEYFTTKSDGMGIGLSISQSIIDAHGSRLWVTNTPGGGATFHFNLPIVGLDHDE